MLQVIQNVFFFQGKWYLFSMAMNVKHIFFYDNVWNSYVNINILWIILKNLSLRVDENAVNKNKKQK